MKSNVKIACLPVAGIANPYQYLMIKGLNSDTNINAFSGIDDRFFGILRTAIKKKPTYIHFDWITSYYYRRNLWMTLLNIPFFITQVLLVKYFFKAKLVWTLHNIQPHDVKHHKIHAFCRRFFAKQTNWIRLFSEDSMKRVERALKVKCNFIVCPEGSYVNYYKNTISNKEARRKLNIDDNDFVFLYLGFIKPYKGIEDLIDSFKRIDYPNKKLIIAGEAIDKKYYFKIYEKNKNIIFVNKFIDKNEIQYFYNTSNVVVLPFKKIENSGSAILAMGFKKLIIAPKLGVLEERLLNQVNFLYEKNELFKMMEKSISNKGLTLTLGEKNFEELAKSDWELFSSFFV